MRKLIWTCKGGGCGGYADRLKGIVTAYLLAKALGREFFIEWDGVTHLAECFYVPCLFHGSSVPGSQFFRLIDNLTTDLQVSALRMLSAIKAEVVYIQINQYDEPHWRLLGMDNGDSMESTFSRVLNTLLAPTPRLTTHPAYLEAANFLALFKAIGVQVRTGEQNYPYEHDLKRIDPREVWERVLPAEAVFIASDSPAWKNDFAAAHPRVPSYQIPFAPAHIERSDPDLIRQTFMLTVIEHQILSKCSAVYTGVGGFGRTAAWWGGKPCIDLIPALAHAGAEA